MEYKNEVLLISGSNPDMTPFVGFYEALLKTSNIPYCILYWNRHGYIKTPSVNTYVYERDFNNDSSKFQKLYESYLFYRFCRKHLEEYHYKRIICFTIMPFVFFDRYLIKNFKDNYIFDIRDYSPILRFEYFRNRINNIINNSAFTVISSEGFKVWLPKKNNYIISHNIDSSLIYKAPNYYKKKGNIIILTIGYMIRYNPNDLIIDAFGNCRDIELRFVGEGPAATPLKKHCDEKGYNNVLFSGRYKKDEELGFYEDSDMINILLLHGINSDSCMSNRFYNAVVARKPMIVNEGCYQAELVEKYHLGVVIYNYERIKETVLNYWNSLDWNTYEKGCQEFLSVVSKDNATFEARVVGFCKEL